MTFPSSFHLQCSDTTIFAASIPHLPKTQRHEAEQQAIATLIRENISPSATLSHLPSGAPIIVGSPLFISISHGAGTALLATSPSHPIGIDIEAPRPQLLRIARRFMTSDEYNLYGHAIDTALAAWTAKEATFKAAGIPDLTIGEIQVDLANNRATARGRNFTLHHFCSSHHTICLANPERR